MCMIDLCTVTRFKLSERRERVNCTLILNGIVNDDCIETVAAYNLNTSHFHIHILESRANDTVCL